MPRLGHRIIDGLALVLVGTGLAAIVAGYQSNLPAPPLQVAELASSWADPLTTGSITRATKADAAPIRPTRKSEAPAHPAVPGPRVWIDPPSR